MFEKMFESFGCLVIIPVIVYALRWADEEATRQEGTRFSEK